MDYLLKPFTPERLAEALDEVRRRRNSAPAASPAAEEVARPARGGAFLDRILVRDGTRIHVVRTDRLEYVEAQDDYVALVSGGQKLRKQQTLSELEKALDPGRFVRIHRSYLLCVDALESLELYAKDSRAGYARLRELL